MPSAHSKLFALFQDSELAAEAINHLRSVGVSQEDVQVVSGVPFPEDTFREHPPGVPLQWVTLAGGFLGVVAGLLLAGGTAMLYKILTGHMDVVAPPPVGIITYEVMMLGAIVFTIVGLFLGLQKGRPRLDEPRLGEGFIGVLVPAATKESETAIEAVLQESEAVEVRRLAEEEL